MDRLHYKVSYADNGIIINDTDEDSLDVFQQQENEEIEGYTARAISERIAKDIASMMLAKSKGEFKINIAIF